MTLRQNLAKLNLTIPGQDMADVWRFYQPIPQWVGRPDENAAAELRPDRHELVHPPVPYAQFRPDRKPDPQ